ncbi:cadherin-related hmr-1-like [Palaemon carinicauda]|uniref:cadherin-related hmr-1-like n=1 Tax=Palaemon carinicauda TaxID=392227 RepID=UPI0035B66D67
MEPASKEETKPKETIVFELSKPQAFYTTTLKERAFTSSKITYITTGPFTKIVMQWHTHPNTMIATKSPCSLAWHTICFVAQIYLGEETLEHTEHLRSITLKHELIVNGEGGGQLVQAVVDVTVTDVNDNEPFFIKPSLHITVIEEDDRHLPTSLLKVEAKDPDEVDQMSLRYSISGDGVDGYLSGDAYFSINSRSGDLVQLKALDRDPPNGKRFWRLIVRVEDGQKNWKPKEQSYYLGNHFQTSEEHNQPLNMDFEYQKDQGNFLYSGGIKFEDDLEHNYMDGEYNTWYSKGNINSRFKLDTGIKKDSFTALTTMNRKKKRMRESNESPLSKKRRFFNSDILSSAKVKTVNSQRPQAAFTFQVDDKQSHKANDHIITIERHPVEVNTPDNQEEITFGFSKVQTRDPNRYKKTEFNYNYQLDISDILVNTMAEQVTGSVEKSSKQNLVNNEKKRHIKRNEETIESRSNNLMLVSNKSMQEFMLHESNLKKSLDHNDDKINKSFPKRGDDNHEPIIETLESLDIPVDENRNHNPHSNENTIYTVEKAKNPESSRKIEFKDVHIPRHQSMFPSDSSKMNKIRFSWNKRIETDQINHGKGMRMTRFLRKHRRSIRDVHIPGEIMFPGDQTSHEYNSERRQNLIRYKKATTEHINISDAHSHSVDAIIEEKYTSGNKIASYSNISTILHYGKGVGLTSLNVIDPKYKPNENSSINIHSIRNPVTSKRSIFEWKISDKPHGTLAFQEQDNKRRKNSSASLDRNRFHKTSKRRKGIKTYDSTNARLRTVSLLTKRSDFDQELSSSAFIKRLNSKPPTFPFLDKHNQHYDNGKKDSGFGEQKRFKHFVVHKRDLGLNHREKDSIPETRFHKFHNIPKDSITKDIHQLLYSSRNKPLHPLYSSESVINSRYSPNYAKTLLANAGDGNIFPPFSLINSEDQEHNFFLQKYCKIYSHKLQSSKLSSGKLLDTSNKVKTIAEELINSPETTIIKPPHWSQDSGRKYLYEYKANYIDSDLLEPPIVTANWKRNQVLNDFLIFSRVNRNANRNQKRNIHDLHVTSWVTAVESMRTGKNGLSDKISFRRKRNTNNNINRIVNAVNLDDNGDLKKEDSCPKPTDSFNEHVSQNIYQGDIRVHSAEMTVTIIVKDINDNPPVFSNVTMFGEIQENGPAELSVAQVSAWDNDDATEGTNARITYFIEKNVIHDKTGEAIFYIHPKSGLVTTAICCLDRETTPEYHIQVVAADGGGLKGTGTVLVRLRDENDNPPHFSRKSWDLEIVETHGEGPPDIATLLEMTVGDLDSQNDFSFRIVEDSGPGWDRFGIRSSGASGQLYARQKLDYEDEGHRLGFRFIVQVTDKGEEGWEDPHHQDAAWVGIRLKDCNDNPPFFKNSNVHLSVIEDTTPGTILVNMTATDPDKHKECIKKAPLCLMEERGQSFNKGPNIMITEKGKDREEMDEGNFSEENILEARERLEEAEEEFVAKQIPVDPKTEGMKVERYVEAEIRRIAAEKNFIKWKLMAEEREEARRAKELEARQEEAREVARMCTLGKDAEPTYPYLRTRGRKWQESISKECWSNQLKAVASMVKKNSTSQNTKMKKQSGKDEEENKPPNVYKMNRTNPKSIDAFKPYIYEGNFDFVVKDSLAVKGVGVLVGNEVDGAPFVLCHIVTEIPLKYSPTTELEMDYPYLFPSCMTIRSMWKKVVEKEGKEIKGAMDLDSLFSKEEDSLDGIQEENSQGKGGQVKYKILGPLDTLRMEEFGGLTLYRALDRESDDEVEKVFRILAMDQGDPSLTSTATLTVTVTDVNDCPPRLLPPTVLQVKEGEPPSLLGVLSVTDDDVWSLGHGPPFSLALAASNSRNIFDLVQLKFYPLLFHGRGGAEIWTRRSLDREAHHELKVKIFLSDFGNLNSTQIVTIIVGDLNDNPMKPASKTVYLWKTENTGSEAPLGRVYVDDPDDWDVGDKTFDWAGKPFPLFTLNNDDGTIYASSQVREGRYFLQFSVTDHVWKQEDVSANVTVIVRVLTNEALTHAASIFLMPTTPENLTRGWVPLVGGGKLGKLINAVQEIPALAGYRIEVVSIYGINSISDPAKYDSFAPTNSNYQDDLDPIGDLNLSNLIRQHTIGLDSYACVWMSVTDYKGVFMDPVRLQGLIALHSRDLEDATGFLVAFRNPSNYFEQDNRGMKKFLSQPLDLGKEDSVSGTSEYIPSPTLIHISEEGPDSISSMASTLLPLQVVDTNLTSLVTPLLRSHECPPEEKSSTSSFKSASTSCTPSSCFNEGSCIGFSTGNRCICPGGSKGPRCKIYSRTFWGNGWAWLKPPSSCLPMTLSIRLLTKKSDGIILYNGPLAPPSDAGRAIFTPMFTVQLVNQKPQILIQGFEEFLMLQVNKGVSDGDWHTIYVHVDGLGVSMMVDICGFGRKGKLHGDSRCIDRKTWRNLRAMRMWESVGPLQIGGIAQHHPRSVDFGWQDSITPHHFDGCLSHLTINDRVVDLGETPYSQGSSPRCHMQDLACLDNDVSCGFHSECTGGLKMPKCTCEPGWSGLNCETPTIPTTLGPNSYIKMALSFTPHSQDISIQIRVRTQGLRNGLLLHLVTQQTNSSLSLHLQSGVACASMSVAGWTERSACVNGNPIGDGKWHTIRAERHEHNLIAIVDDGDDGGFNFSIPSFVTHFDDKSKKVIKSPRTSQIDKHDSVTIGGLPRLMDTREDLEGTCIDDLRISDRQLPLPPSVNGSSWGQVTYSNGVIQGCQPNSSCQNITCKHPLSCHPNWLPPRCSCGPGLHYIDHACADVDECLLQPCLHGGTCVNFNPGYNCICGPDYLGENCEWAKVIGPVRPHYAPVIIASITSLFFALGYKDLTT